MNANENVVNLFIEQGSGYTDYRIPAMVVAESGVIYVAFECREDQSDWAKIDLRIMKSVDQGESFQEIHKIFGYGNTLNNPLLIVKGDRIHFLYCENYRRVFHIQSDDEGLNWSEPRELTHIFGEYTHTVVAVGPGHGVVTTSGTMVAPVWLAYNPEDEFAHNPSFLITIFSEDDGETWKAGERIMHEDLVDANETAIALTNNGSVIMSVRNRHPKWRFRYWVTSPNGYTEWTHLGFDERFPDPHCMGSLCNGNGYLFFSNCNSLVKRENLTVKVSMDDFQSFEQIYISENAAYSEVAYWNHYLFVLYETYEECDGVRINHRLFIKRKYIG